MIADETQERVRLSGFVICLNEEACIEACLRSLDICDEIVVVDSGSTDRTLEILEALREEGLPIRLHHQDWLGYAAQKQSALNRTRGEWILSLDADEYLDKTLRRTIPELVAKGARRAYSFSRRNLLPGYGFVPEGVDAHPIIRLAPRDAARFDERIVVHEGIDVDVPVERVRPGALMHDRPLPLDEQMLKENRYSTLKARYVYETTGRPRYLKLFFNPMLYFVRIYFWRGLWRCGWAGLIQAGIGAVYSWMTEAKILQHHLKARHEAHRGQR